ncbi:MAG: phosphocholine-specific phospholipase C [Phenylobacterium sp.]|uniref:phosphocholine-specific phospholipase C n=1 Tax=Phenylobacterium sp. TaxID=1871053 RepID=UPI00391988B7
MPRIDRRSVLAGAAGFLLPPAIARARGIDAAVRTGTIADVEHVVIFMQENRSFDHYFGTMNGVRGFGDRFPIPLSDVEGAQDRTVWVQEHTKAGAGPRLIAPFPLDTAQSFALMRVEGTPHSWPDAQAAWDEGRMSRWPDAKTAHAMGYYRASDIPFQFALADAFTLCDAYHCSIQTGTNTNRLMLWTGTNDPGGKNGGPAIGNSHDNVPSLGGHPQDYTWTTYVERLGKAGITWRVYQDMADNFEDNPLAGFASFRQAFAGAPGADPVLKELGLGTRKLDGLKADVLAGRLPQVSFIVAPAAESEHPGPSSPAQGADYTAQVLDALTADPKVWARTVLFIMFDENDGFFDHVPPPAPPSRDAARPGGLAGGSTADLTGEHHLVRSEADAPSERPELIGRPYGLGPRVPLYVVSPWSRGGFVNSQVADHTSVIRFLETRFGVTEPNISPWRRAVCGDLTSCFDFRTPNDAAFTAALPATAAVADRAKALPGRTTPATPAVPHAPEQAAGPRPSRALPYALDVAAKGEASGVRLTFRNIGAAAAVLHVYDRKRLDQAPRRYTVEPRKSLTDLWDDADGYDLWVLGPNGFHRHFAGLAAAGEPEVMAAYDARRALVTLTLRNPTREPLTVQVKPSAYGEALAGWTAPLDPHGAASKAWRLGDTGGWYDLTLTVDGEPAYLRRLAGRLETGRDSVTDPAMAGPALMTRPL